MNTFLGLLQDNDVDLVVTLEVTHRCNLRCTYCFQEKPKQPQELSIKDWVTVISILNKLFYEKIQFKIVGGEVFQRKSVIDLMRDILESNVKLTTVSNGVQVPDEFFNLCKEHIDNSFLEISLDGSKRIHDLHRGGFKHAIVTLRRAMSEGLAVAIRVSVYKTNAPHLSDFISEIYSLREFRYSKPVFYFQPLFSTNEHMKNLLLTLAEYSEIAACIKSKHPEIVQHWRILDRKAFRRSYRKMRVSPSRIFGCDTGASLVIKPNGDFSGCELESPRGNILDYLNNYASLWKIVQKINTPSALCDNCYNMDNCGACRLAPLMHNYTNTFGFPGCREYVNEVMKIRERNF